jgi:HAD superfamily hydrolase (TIGR01509 family)
MFQGMIFDLDGVVVDSHPIHLRAWKRLFCLLGRPLADHQLDFILDGHRREQILRHYLGDVPLKELREYGLTKEKLFREESNDAQPIAGVLAFLGVLEQAGIKKAIASSARRERAEYMLQRLDIARRFDAVVTADDLAADKPDPHIFCLAGERLGLCPSNTLVAEDAISGVKAARAAGMRCIGIASHCRAQLLLGAGADKVFGDFLSVSLAELESLFGTPTITGAPHLPIQSTVSA